MNTIDNVMLAEHWQQGCLNFAALRMGQAHTVGHKVRVDPQLAALHNLHTAPSLTILGADNDDAAQCKQLRKARQAPRPASLPDGHACGMLWAL
jgi:hypothetical protein